MEIDQVFFLTWLSFFLPVLGVFVLALMINKVLKKLDVIESKMGDLNLRLTITETRLEERQKLPVQVEDKQPTPKKRGRPKKKTEKTG
ncbi:MAG: hypothetical protein ACLFUW_00415 [Bacteroidales bacterium]